jgi:hypothetical protein
MPSETSNTRAIVDDLPFLQELVGIAQDMVTTLRHRAKTQVPERFVMAFAMKAAQTARGIVILYQNGLPLEAQSLVRTLFEVRVSFDAFLRLLQNDPKAACQRMRDAMMLEKIKQQRASSFAGHELVTGAPGPEEVAQKEQEIVSRYSDPELKSLRKNGFSGLNVEDRARQAGCEENYHIVFRKFSRNVHGSDFNELMLANDTSLLEDRRADFFEGRDGAALETAFISLWAVADQVNRGFRLSQGHRLLKLVEARRCASTNPRNDGT